MNCFLTGIRKPRIFRGYCSYWYARRYADRRFKLWKNHWDQAGKQQGVFPYTDITLIVCSKSELKYFNKKSMIRNKMNPRKLIKKAYYTTPL
jgi:hypothetical protein